MIRERIKNETASLHKALEEQSLGDRIMSGILTEAEYKHIIKMNYDTNAAFEKTWNDLPFDIPHSLMLQHRHKTPSLKLDMELLDLDTTVIPNLKFSIGSYAEFIGALYVFEGSTLGGAVILKQLKKNKNLAHLTDFNFYNCYGDKLGMYWKLFLDHLNQIQDNDEVEACINAANHTFGILKDYMESNRSQY